MSNQNIENDKVVTVVVSRRIKKGTEKIFERLSDDLTVAAASFTGYLGAVMMRPSSENDPEYRLVYKFDNQENLDNWITSNKRVSLLKKMEPLLEGPCEATSSSGILTWLTLSGKTKAAAPKKYKITIVSWLALYPLITLIFFLFGDILADIPLVIRTFIVTAIAMLIMSYVLMPQFTKWFSFWLFPKDIR